MQGIDRRMVVKGLALAGLAGTGATRAAASGDWKARWNGVLAAAEKEGALNLSVPSGSQWRTELMAFEKAYPKIKTSMTPATSRDFWPRMMKEREIGQHLWDMRIGGGDTPVYEMIAQNALADIRPMLILPDVADEATWHGGFDHMYVDKAKKHVLSFCVYTTSVAVYNPAFVKPGELGSVKDLVDPRWKGRIVIDDPRGGSSATAMTLLYTKFGADFVRDLLAKQDVVIATNPRQIMGWFVSGKYPIAFGIPNSAAQQFADSGVKFEMADVKGIDQWSLGVGGIQVMERRPNPNATTVFINWLLTKDVQARIMKTVRLNSRRKDVPLGDPERAIDWSRYRDYVTGQSEDFFVAMTEFKKLSRTILK